MKLIFYTYSLYLLITYPSAAPPLSLSPLITTSLFSITVSLLLFYFIHCGGGLVTESCPTLATPWTVARLAPLSIVFSRQEYRSGLPFPSPGDLPNPGIKPGSPALQADSPVCSIL